MGRNKKDVDAEELVDLLERGIPQKEIAVKLEITPPTLSKRIAELQKEQGVLLQYRPLQSLQLTKLQAAVLERITPEKIADAPLRDLILAYKILKDKELVIEGKPSDIKGLVGYLIELEKLEADGKMPAIEDQDQEDFVVN